MAVTINSNIASLQAQRSLASANDALSKTYNRLGSGLRINTAADDAAGLAVSSSLKTSTRVYTQSIRNLSDGISALSIASGATTEMSSILARLKELATQSANGTLGFKQRKALDTEAQALRDEFNRITDITKFNGINLISDDSTRTRLQLGDTSQNGGITIQTGNVGAGRIGNGSFNTSSVSLQNDGGAFIGDFNNDGIADLASMDYSGGLGILRVGFGNGDGTFRSGTTQTISLNYYGYANGVGDFDGNGNLDLLTIDQLGNGIILYGNGNGTFGAETQFSDSIGSYAPLIVDLNNDGKDDIVSANQTFISNGNGTFKTSINSESAIWNTYDINGDGKTDLFGGNGSPFILIELGNGDGTFKTATSIFTAAGTTYICAAGDVNGDGRTDIVSADSTGYIWVSLGNQDGSFKAAVSSAITGSPDTDSPTWHTFVLEDFDGDGKKDLLMGGSRLGEINLVTFNSTGAFQSSTTLGAAGTLLIGDINNDGALDFLEGTGTDYQVNIAVTKNTSKLDEFNLKTRRDSLYALQILDKAQERLSLARGLMGSDESRVLVAQRVIGNVRENYSVALSRVEDIDVASESSTLVQQQIQRQAGAAILAQANQQPSLALTLLRG